MFIKTIIRQGEKIIELDKVRKDLEKEKSELENKHKKLTIKYLNTIGILDDAQEEFLHILDHIEEILSANDYGRADIKVSRALEYIRKEIEIIEEDLDINKESSNNLDEAR